MRSPEPAKAHVSYRLDRMKIILTHEAHSSGDTGGSIAKFQLELPLRSPELTHTLRTVLEPPRMPYSPCLYSVPRCWRTIIQRGGSLAP